MNKQELSQIVKNMVAAPSCCPELKAAGQEWLDTLGVDAEKNAAAALLEEAREDACTIDQVIEFFESPHGVQVFGVEQAKAMANHAHEVKDKGGKWCDCPACDACLKIRDNASLLD